MTGGIRTVPVPEIDPVNVLAPDESGKMGLRDEHAVARLGCIMLPVGPAAVLAPGPLVVRGDVGLGGGQRRRPSSRPCLAD